MPRKSKKWANLHGVTRIEPRRSWTNGDPPIIRVPCGTVTAKYLPYTMTRLAKVEGNPESRSQLDFFRMVRLERGGGKASFDVSYSSLRSPRITLPWYRLSQNTESRVRPSSRNPIFFAKARLASFSAKVHHVRRWRLSCSNASCSSNRTTSVPYPFFHRSFSPMARPMSAPVALRVQP